MIPEGVLNRLRAGLLIGLGVLQSPVAGAQPALDRVVSTERAFARDALIRGIKPAFLTYMADSAIMQYGGQLQLAKPIWQRFPTLTDRLCWGPAFAGVSQAGDLGYTHGPYYTEVDGKPTQAGHFVTIWQRQPTGDYRFVLDLGADSPAFVEAIPARETRSTIPTAPLTTLAANFALTHDQAFADRLVEDNDAYAAVVSSEIVLYRTNQRAVTGTGGALAQLKTEPSRRFRVMGGQLAQSGDVAYAYGTFESVAPGAGRGLYARFWRHEAGRGWRLLLEVLSRVAD